MAAIDTLLAGKTIAHVVTNGHVLAIRCTDQAELRIVWCDDNGDVVKGHPQAIFDGTHIVTKPIAIPRC